MCVYELVQDKRASALLQCLPSWLVIVLKAHHDAAGITVSSRRGDHGTSMLFSYKPKASTCSKPRTTWLDGGHFDYRGTLIENKTFICCEPPTVLLGVGYFMEFFLAYLN